MALAAPSQGPGHRAQCIDGSPAFLAFAGSSVFAHPRLCAMQWGHTVAGWQWRVGAMLWGQCRAEPKGGGEEQKTGC
eukprot:1150866-Pelagomonas_calceolata.AAC.3